MQYLPFIFTQEELPELSLAWFIVLGELHDHIQGTLQIKRTDDGFCEGVPAGGNRVNEHFGLDWRFQTEALCLKIDLQSRGMEDALC